MKTLAINLMAKKGIVIIDDVILMKKVKKVEKHSKHPPSYESYFF